jgi:hypothetical protein
MMYMTLESVTISNQGDYKDSQASHVEIHPHFPPQWWMDLRL